MPLQLQKLQNEHHQTALALKAALEEMEERVAERTAELQQANLALQAEVAERVRSEKALQERERLLQLVIDNIPQVLFWKDRNSVYLGGNMNLVKMVGKDSPDDFIGKTDFDFSYTQEEATFYRECDRQVMENDAPQVHILETMRRSDGCTRYLDTNKIPIHGAAGEVIGILGTFEDITERIEAEEALRKSEERLRTVVTNASIILFAVDKEGCFTLSEGLGLSVIGLQPGQVVGQSIYEFYADHPQIIEGYERALDGEAFVITNPVGSLYFETHYSPMIQPNGENAGVIGVALNVTEKHLAEIALVQAKEAAEAASRAKSQFLASMSHELRTPLNAIIGFSEILTDQTFGELNAKQARYAGNILTSGRHLLQLINAILDLAKIEAGRMELLISPFDVGKAVREVQSVLRGLAAKKKLQIETELPADLPPLSADEGKFKQILYNLLSNAIKFTPENGNVTITAVVRHSRVEGRLLEVAVRDNGVGISLEDQARIFEEFEQVDSSYARTQQGTGLGLALTRRLIERHGGMMWVQSDGPDRGSVFCFTLPIDNVALTAE